MLFKRTAPVLMIILLIAGCGQNPFQEKIDLEFREAVLTALPCNPGDVTIMQPYGLVSLPSEPYRYHPGIDISTHSGDPFYSCADGVIDSVNLDTGQGYPGTNYRIVIKLTNSVSVDYHFEIGGTALEEERRNNVFVSAGDHVTAGQHIANLLVYSDAGHVDFGMNVKNDRPCPLDYCTADIAQQFEDMYDQPTVEKRPGWRDDLR